MTGLSLGLFRLQLSSRDEMRTDYHPHSDNGLLYNRDGLRLKAPALTIVHDSRQRHSEYLLGK